MTRERWSVMCVRKKRVRYGRVEEWKVIRIKDNLLEKGGKKEACKYRQICCVHITYFIVQSVLSRNAGLKYLPHIEKQHIDPN